MAGLNPGTTYEWRVKANCSAGLVSPWSNVESYTTLGGTGISNDDSGQGSELMLGSKRIHTTESNDARTFVIPGSSEQLFANPDERNNDVTVGSVSVWPNPVKDLLNVRYQQTESSAVSGLILSDLSGKVVIRKAYQAAEVTEFQEQLDVSRLAAGMYVLQVATTTGIVSEKVMIMN
jgi:hypothetical protein